MVCEYAQNVLGLDCMSTEWDESTPNKIFDILPNQTKIYGGTMRLGTYTTQIVNKNSLLYESYLVNEFNERHRHRYEFNNDYKKIMENNGMIFSGVNPESGLVEVIELNDKKFYLGCQYHPEYNTRYNKPNPLFVKFLSIIY